MNNKILVLKFPGGCTPAMKKIIFFHECCLIIVVFVLAIVFILLVENFFLLGSVNNNIENSFLEIVWTLGPTLIIFGLMVVSLDVLYYSEDTGGLIYSSNIKVVGHQWYWSYEGMKVGPEAYNFDSYMLTGSDLQMGDFRKVEVDNPLLLNVNEAARVMITSSDVIHSWAVPEFRVKVDAIPGRLNQFVFIPIQVGKFYGYCMELCGVNHSFMPIVVEVVN